MSSSNSPKNKLVTWVSVLGTGAAMLGVGHALYQSLSTGPGWNWLALGESIFLALFLEFLVASTAYRARWKVRSGEPATLEILVVLTAALVSGLVSGMATGWGSAALYRSAVPIFAGITWLGDVLLTLRIHRAQNRRGPLGLIKQRCLVRLGLTDHGEDQIAMDRSRLLSKIIHTIAVVGESSGRTHRRADRRMSELIARYEAIGGDREVLTYRANGYHHRRDLLLATGPSPYRLSPGPIESDCGRGPSRTGKEDKVEPDRLESDSVAIESDRTSEESDSVGPELLMSRSESDPKEEKTDSSQLESVRLGPTLADSSQTVVNVGVRSDQNESDSLLQMARKIDQEHRAEHGRPASSETIRRTLGVGTSRARGLTKALRSDSVRTRTLDESDSSNVINF